MPSTVPAGGYTPPIYPYARLDELKQVAARAGGGLVDLSIGTPMDPVPELVVRALAQAGPSAAGYPRAVGGPKPRREVDLERLAAGADRGHGGRQRGRGVHDDEVARREHVDQVGEAPVLDAAGRASRDHETNVVSRLAPHFRRLGRLELGRQLEVDQTFECRTHVATSSFARSCAR